MMNYAVSEVYVEMKKPVSKMKHFCSCIKERKSVAAPRRKGFSFEKAINVVPITISRSCQDLVLPPIINKYTQSHVPKVKHCPTQCESDKCFCGEHDVGVAVEQETCTCAAQCTLRCQGENVRKVNVGTMHNNAYKRTTSVAIQYEHYRRCVKHEICDLCENPKFPLPKLKSCQCHPCNEPPECPPYTPDADEDRWQIPCWEDRKCTTPRYKRTRNILCQCDPCGDNNSGSGSYTSIFCESDTDCTGNTVTDTICTHVAIDYDNDKHKRRVTVVKKNNQSTITDKHKVVDVSTITGDWWSPIVERKRNITLEKKTGDYSINQNEKKVMEDKSSRGISPNKHFAPIKRHERHQASKDTDGGILSPSKYILESQGNDYELFSPRIPPIVAMTCVKKLNVERSNYHRHTRKGHKSKRLEESYSPRKKTQTSSVSVASPAKWRPVDRNEDTSHALRHHRCRDDKLKSSQKSRGMPKGREKGAYARAAKHARRLHVTKSFTDNEKDGDSVAGQCNSTSSLAIN